MSATDTSPDALGVGLSDELSPAVRAALADILDRFVAGLDLLRQLTEAVAKLDEIDDLRAGQIRELQLTVRLLCAAQGLETKGEPLVDLARSYLDSLEASVRVPNDLRAASDEELLDRVRHARANLAEARAAADLDATRAYARRVEQLSAEIRRRLDGDAAPEAAAEVRHSLGLGYCVRCREWIPSGEGAESGGEPYHRSCYQLELQELRERRADLDA